MTQLYTDPFGPPWKLNWLRLILHWKGSLMQFFWVELIFATLITTIAISIYYFVAKGTPTADLKESSQSLM
eukprot:scaffold380575_cov71-Attheya_sp.AAC.1